MTPSQHDRPRPAHIPESRVFDFDLFNDPRYEVEGDMHAVFRKLVTDAPGIFWTPRNGGHWVMTEHALLTEAMRLPEIFSSRYQSIPPIQNEGMLIPVNMDPPDHAKHREPLNKAFSPKAMSALRCQIRELAAQLIDNVAREGRCDFVAAVAEPLPVMIFMKVVGLPLERLPEFRLWVQQILSNRPEREHARQNVSVMINELIEARKAKREDDLISRLIDTEIDGAPIPMSTLQGYGMLLFIAGLDTVVNGMSFAVRHMARNPDLQETLRADPKKIPDAVEEMLRRYTFTLPGRTVCSDVQWHGVDLRKGERVLMCLPSGDLDDRTYPDPMTYDLRRANNVHYAFGIGFHRCVGSHLARIELQVLYEEWLMRIPAFRMDPAEKERFHGAQVLAVEYLPLVWDKEI